MYSNRYLEIQDAIDAARARLSLIREGIVPLEDDGFMPRRRGPGPRVSVERQRPAVRRAAVGFHIPATRSYRLTSPAGTTSFHFSHRSIGKVTFDTCEDGVRVKPGAARAHGRYVEREAAVAEIGLGCEPSFGPAAAEIDADTNHQTDPRKEQGHDYTHDQRIDPWLGAGLVEGASASEPGAGGFLAGPVLGRPVEDALADARVRLLPRRDVVRHGGGAHGLLRSAADVSVEAGAGDLGLRCASAGDRDEGGRLDTPSLRSRADARGHDDYIGRPGAVAIQPDGRRALITNIDTDDDERAKFWSLVEEHEAVNRGDRMSLRIADNPGFWSRVAADAACPAALKDALTKASPNETIRFDIPSGKEMRSFLAGQPGWVSPTSGRRGKGGTGGPKPFAGFHDGRSGRTQFRIVGELPDELDSAGRFAIIKDFADQFARRKLPFVAVMHAPDHKNDERNWHFHLIYYDRPCRRITGEDIAHLSAQGYRSDHLEPGMWDFAVVTPKKGRTNGKAVPLKQNKVAEVAQDGWIEMLRRELAAITNRHLAAARVGRRLDPRRYEEMGIVADPQEHLGTAQAAAETRGEATHTGSENERRQYAAIMAEGDARLAATIASIEAAGPRGGSSAADWSVERQALIEAAELRHMAFALEQDIDRARSRAAAVQRKNRQLLDAYDADPAAGTGRERREAGELADAATRYLARLDHTLGADLALPAQARALADQTRNADVTVSRAPLLPVRDERPVGPVREAHTATAMQPAAEPSGADPARPSHSDEGTAQERAASAAAKRAAMAAALRGQGR